MLFVLTCIDKPHSSAVRAEARPRHLAYVEAHRSMVRLAGPFLSPDGASMTGSLLIIEADDRAAVEAFSSSDPYVLAGLFASVDIRPWRCSIGAIAP